MFSSPVPHLYWSVWFLLLKKNINESANVSGDGSANNTADGDVEIEEKAPVVTAGG